MSDERKPACFGKINNEDEVCLRCGFRYDCKQKQNREMRL